MQLATLLPADIRLPSPNSEPPANPEPPSEYFRGGVTLLDAEFDSRLKQDEGRNPDVSASGETKRWSTLQRLVLAMAKAKYDWMPDGRRNSATGEKTGSICADVVAHLGEGRRISPDTIRDVLNQADKDFPGKE